MPFDGDVAERIADLVALKGAIVDLQSSHRQRQLWDHLQVCQRGRLTLLIYLFALFYFIRKEDIYTIFMHLLTDFEFIGIEGS